MIANRGSSQAASQRYHATKTRNSRLDRWLGELSYPFYLLHLIGIGLAGGGAIGAACITFVLAAVTHVAVQLPVEAFFKRRAVLSPAINPVSGA